MTERISYLDREPDLEPDRIRVGDVVKTGSNDYPRFTVIAIDSGRAWLRNTTSGDDAVVSLEECCWRVREPHPHQRIGREKRKPKSAKTGPNAPVEPKRIDRPVPKEQPDPTSGSV